MPRISGVNIPEEKRIEIALTYVFGIGSSLSSKILKELKIDPDKKAKELTTQEVTKLREKIDKNYIIEGDLRRKLTMDVKRLKDINSYRGSRHIKKLPARGQRTKTNNRTVRGNVRKTVGSGRKPPAQAT